MNSSETTEVRGRGGGVQRESVLVVSSPLCRPEPRSPGGPPKTGLAPPDSPFGLGRDLLFWLGFEEAGREGQLAGRAQVRHEVQDPSLSGLEVSLEITRSIQLTSQQCATRKW